MSRTLAKKSRKTLAPRIASPVTIPWYSTTRRPSTPGVVVTIIVPPDADLAATGRRDNLFVLSAAMAAEVAMRVSGPLVALLLLLAAGVAHAQSLGPDEQRQIRAVIESQIDAFRKDDGERAFS